MKDNYGGQFPSVLFNVILLSLLTSSSRQNSGNFNNKKTKEESQSHKTDETLNTNKGYNDYFDYEPRDDRNIFQMNFGDYYNPGNNFEPVDNTFDGSGINLENLKMPFPEYYQGEVQKNKELEEQESSPSPETPESPIVEEFLMPYAKEEVSEIEREVELPKKEPRKIVWKNFPKPIK